MAGSARRAKVVTGEHSCGAVARHSGEQKSGGAERGRGRKQDREVLYHSAELQRRSNGEEEQRGGGSAELRASPTMAAVAARVLRRQGWRLWFNRVSRGAASLK